MCFHHGTWWKSSPPLLQWRTLSSPILSTQINFSLHVYNLWYHHHWCRQHLAFSTTTSLPTPLLAYPPPHLCPCKAQVHSQFPSVHQDNPKREWEIERKGGEEGERGREGEEGERTFWCMLCSEAFTYTHTHTHYNAQQYEDEIPPLVLPLPSAFSHEDAHEGDIQLFPVYRCIQEGMHH